MCHKVLLDATFYRLIEIAKARDGILHHRFDLLARGHVGGEAAGGCADLCRHFLRRVPVDATTKTFAPSAAKRRHMAAPKPEPPPVTMIFFSLRCI
jgi:hypothetical protein